MRASWIVPPEVRIAEATVTSEKSQDWRSRIFSKWKSAPAQVPGMRMEVSRSPASITVMRSMSMPGPMKKSSASYTVSPEELVTTICASQRDHGGARCPKG